MKFQSLRIYSYLTNLHRVSIILVDASFMTGRMFGGLVGVGLGVQKHL